MNADLETKANELEEEIIKKEILPILSKNIEPALKPVQRELALVVDYKPGKPLSLHLARNLDFAAVIPDAKEIALDPEVSHGSREQKDGKAAHGHPTDLVVRFPDGTTIAEPFAADTFQKVIEKIGVARVRQVVNEQNLVFSKVPVISNRRDSKYGRAQRDLGDGWLLITHSNTKMKKAFIEKVSEALGLGLEVTIIK